MDEKQFKEITTDTIIFFDKDKITTILECKYKESLIPQKGEKKYTKIISQLFGYMSKRFE